MSGGEIGDVDEDGKKKEETEKEEKRRGAEAQANPPCSSLLAFFIRDLCFIRLSERKTRFPSSPQ